LVPRTNASTWGCAAISRAENTPAGVSTIAQIRVSGPTAAATRSTWSRPLTLGTTTAAGRACAAAARSAPPQGVSRPLQRMVSVRPAVLAATRGGAGRVARRLLGVGGDGVLEVEDQRVGGSVWAFSSAAALDAGR
jgi:hypothetical protein